MSKFQSKRILGHYELKKCNPWLNKGRSESLDERNQAKLQWLQYPSEINRDNPNNVRHEAT
jgi:hypothetical protein